MNSLAASITALVLLGGCSASGGRLERQEVETVAKSDVEGVRGGETQLRVGQTMSIGLGSNATTGYRWQVSEVEGGVLTPGTPFGEEITDAHAPGMVGVGGTTHWQYVASQPGTVTLTFTYGRPWERDMPPAETETFRVVVR